MLSIIAPCVTAVPAGKARTVGVEVDGLPFAQRCLCSSGTPTLLGTRHRLCVISRPVSRSAPGNGAPAAAPQLWQRQWVIIEFGKV